MGSSPILLSSYTGKESQQALFCLTKWQHRENSWEFVQWFWLCHITNLRFDRGDHLCAPICIVFQCRTSWAVENFEVILSLTSVKPFEGYFVNNWCARLPSQRAHEVQEELQLQWWSTRVGLNRTVQAIFWACVP